ncbi:MAG: sulfotransferase family protein [Roseivirga sp.]|nr:sulfotransferase family protein [Roseivirga sp.]
MEISYRNNFIFVHIWKNAGTSVRQAISPYVYKVNLRRKISYHGLSKLHLPVNEKLERAYNIKSPHLKACEICDLLGQNYYNQFYKFAFARNPYSRLVSQYNHVITRESHKHHGLAGDLGSMEEYVKWRINSDKETFQWQFVTDSNENRIVDFIGKFENLESDLKTLGDNLDLTLKLPHLNRGKVIKETSVEDLFPPKFRDFVKKNYEKDFEYFGYDMDELSY